MEVNRPSIDELVAAAQESRGAAPRLADRVRTLVELAEPLAVIIARTSVGGEARLLSVRVAGPAKELDGTGMLRAAPSVSPELRGAEGHQELHVAIEARNGANELVGDVMFVYSVVGG